ncbi:hypothetical protein [Sphingomonas sp. SRS2]|uniref:hypothetical protein n=1 Tax=Sphingomonas sp. SRS2 TaxID=133190 RepID=UPI0006184BB0|nr:hypothetical protein [Sphingomonas sp. SRS2]KKC23925.1 hypothetical protein WP12_22180 [Sphingomonas sp. SRS2]
MSTAGSLLIALSPFTWTLEWSIEDAATRLDVSGSTACRYFSSFTKAGFSSSRAAVDMCSDLR